MEKLTKSQNYIMEILYNDIKEAKKYDTYEEYVKHTYQLTNKRFQDIELQEQKYKKYWLDKLNNICLNNQVSSNTLKALERKGYIDIIDIDFRRGGVDTIKVIKF